MKPKRSRIEGLLDAVRKKPCPTICDPRQLDFDGCVKDRAFANLDRAIAKALSRNSTRKEPEHA